MARVLAIIPARMASQRLPGKVLLGRTGKPLIQHVWEGAKSCPVIDRIVIATEAEEVVRAVEAFGGEAVLTSPDCQSGSDRVAEAARVAPEAEIVVNIQGDEPEMTPEPLTALVEGMLARADARMGTVAVPWPPEVPLDEPSFVKVVVDSKGDALYFSRSVVPHRRDPLDTAEHQLPDNSDIYLKHVGLYAYRPAFLQEFARLAPTPLENAEKLEQLRVLEHGHKIAVFKSRYRGFEVNTPADYEAFVARYVGSSGQ